MAIGWQSSMETGAPLLDAQRRALVERADALLVTIDGGSDRAVVERALLDFGDYSVRHFSEEEDCHLRGVCPVLQWNGAARAELIKVVSDFRQAYERSGASHELAADLSCELSGWVSRYIPGPSGTLPCVTLAQRLEGPQG
jgi:hemerythrin-like metal-binding protein